MSLCLPVCMSVVLYSCMDACVCSCVFVCFCPCLTAVVLRTFGFSFRCLSVSNSADRGGSIRECVKAEDIPEECKALRRIFFECKRGQLVRFGFMCLHACMRLSSRKCALAQREGVQGGRSAPEQSSLQTLKGEK